MKKILAFVCLPLLILACDSSELKADTTTDLNAATGFLQAALKGDFHQAQTFMVDDSLNKQDLAAIERLNERLTKEEKDAYSGASIRIHESRQINDSATIVSYSNSYRNKVDSLKVVRLNGKWLVDFKYIFDHRLDSLQ